MFVFLGVADISGITGVVSIGVPGKFALRVLGNVALGILCVVPFVFPGVVSLGGDISVTSKGFF